MIKLELSLEDTVYFVIHPVGGRRKLVENSFDEWLLSVCGSARSIMGAKMISCWDWRIHPPPKRRNGSDSIANVANILT